MTGPLPMPGVKLLAVARTVPWLPLGIATTLSVVIVAWPSQDPGPTGLQAVAIFLASAGGFALDDPAGSVLASSPTSMLRRRLLRLLVVWVPVGLVWALALAVRGTDGPEETRTLTAMFAGLVALSMAIAGVIGRRRLRGGAFVAPALLALLFLSTVFPPRWRPLPMGDIPGGLAQITLRWSVAAMVGAVVFLASSRDRAAR